MQKTIPLFPLNLVAFPGETLKLHIFEERYKQLIKDCLSNELHFGIVAVSDRQLNEIGTEMEISELSQVYPDGKMDIVCKGLKVFELLNFHKEIEGKLYSAAEVLFLKDIEGSDLLLLDEIFTKVKLMYRSMNMKIQLPPVDYDFKIYEIAHKIGLNTKQEIELLSIRSEIERLKYCLKHLDYIIPVIGKKEEILKRIRMNGHFKDALPPDFTI